MSDRNPANLVTARSAAAAASGLGDLWSRALLKRLARIDHGRLTLLTPGGTGARLRRRRRLSPAVSVAIHDASVARRLILGGTIGFAEAYMDRPVGLPRPRRAHRARDRQRARARHRRRRQSCAAPRLARAPRAPANSRRGSRRNIAYHYDLGNDVLCRLARSRHDLFRRAVRRRGRGSRDRAAPQIPPRRPDLLELAPGQNLLEIGCGWGGFAELAAGAYGCRVTGLTLSRRQRDYAAERLGRGAWPGAYRSASRITATQPAVSTASPRSR